MQLEDEAMAILLERNMQLEDVALASVPCGLSTYLQKTSIIVSTAKPQKWHGKSKSELSSEPLRSTSCRCCGRERGDGTLGGFMTHLKRSRRNK